MLGAIAYSLIFRQASSLIITITCAIVILVFNICEIAIQEESFNYRFQHYGYLTLFTEAYIFLSIALYIRRSEREYRVDFVKSAETKRMHVFADSLNGKMSELLDCLLPINVVTRFSTQSIELKLTTNS